MTESNMACWYEAKTQEQLASRIQEHVTHLHDRQAWRRRVDDVHAIMYTNRLRASPSGPVASALAVMERGGRQPLKLNVVQSMIDTVCSRIAQNFPLVAVAADGAEWSYKLRARRMTRFVTTKQQETGFRKISPLVFRDACIRGTGITKVTSRRGEIVHDRVPKKEVYIDDLEGRYGEVRNIHHRKVYSRDVLAGMFPKHAKAIREAADTVADDERSELDGDRSHLIHVVESHHLPNGKDDQGRHAITIPGTVLHQGPWKRQRLPYAFMHWCPPDEGFWGMGLAEQLAPIQWAIDQTVTVLNEGFRLGAPLKVFVRRGAKVVKAHLVPHVGVIVEYDGNVPPELRAPSNPVSQQQIQWLIQLFQWAYELAGVSQLAAMGKKPGSLESGDALLVYHDFETERFKGVESQYENHALDCAELQIDEAKEIYTAPREKDGEPIARALSANWVDRDVIEKLDWASVDMDRDRFRLRLKPVNYLSGTWAGKVEKAQSLAKAGLIPGEWLLPLFDNPDLERFTRMQTALFNYAERVVERLMSPNKSMPSINPVADMEFMETHVKAGFLESIADECPPEVETRFSNYLVSLTAKKKAAAASATQMVAGAAGMMGAGPAGPMGLPPAPAPTSMEGAALPNAPMAPPAPAPGAMAA